jgi:hypothetical protein
MQHVAESSAPAAQPIATIPAPCMAQRLPGLTRYLWIRGIGHIHIVYCGFNGERSMTISARPREDSQGLRGLSPGVRAALVRFFLRLVSARHSDWAHDQDGAGGVFEWDLRSNTLRHQHIGYERRCERTCREGL